MKCLDELVSEAFSAGELGRIKPERVDETAILNRTLKKLKLEGEEELDLFRELENPDFVPLDPDKVVYLEPERPVKRRGWRIAAGAVAACLVCAVTLFSLAPTVADAIPGLGRLFHAANQGMGDGYNRENLEWIQAHMQNVTDCVSTTQEGDLSFSVKEAYYDGKYLYCVAQIETSLDPNDPDAYWSYQMKINGKDVDFDYTNSSKEWREIGENTYVNAGVSFPVPMEYRPEEPGDIQVEYRALFYRFVSAGQENEQNSNLYILNDTQEKDGQKHNTYVTITPKEPKEDETSGAQGGLDRSVLGQATATFTAPYDPDGIIRVITEAEDNGVRLLALTASPAGTELVLDVPGDNWSVGVEKKSGGRITMNIGSEFGSAFSKERRTEIDSGESIPYGEKAVIVTASDGTQKAVFEVDLENRTVTVGDETFIETEKARQEAAQAEGIPRQWREQFEQELAKRQEEREQQQSMTAEEMEEQRKKLLDEHEAALEEQKKTLEDWVEEMKEQQENSQASQNEFEFDVADAQADQVEVLAFSLRDDLERAGVLVRVMPEPYDDDEELKKYSLRLLDPDEAVTDSTGTTRNRSGGASALLGCEFATGISAEDDLEGKILTLQVLYGELGEKGTILAQFDVDLNHMTVKPSLTSFESAPAE